MNEAFNTALMLLAVGMITVFTILALIVLLGNFLIRFVNKYVPDSLLSTDGVKTSEGLNGRTIAAIVAAVDIVTKGKGKVESIKKSEER